MLSIPQTLNRYAYTTNDPVNYVDPSGANHDHLIPGALSPFPCMSVTVDGLSAGSVCRGIYYQLAFFRRLAPLDPPGFDRATIGEIANTITELMGYGVLIFGRIDAGRGTIQLTITDEIYQAFLEAGFLQGAAGEVIRQFPQVSQRVIAIGWALLEALRYYARRLPQWDVSCYVAPTSQAGDHETIPGSKEALGYVTVRARSGFDAIAAARPELTRQMQAIYGPNHRLIHCEAKPLN
jgi:hypothetical protein